MLRALRVPIFLRGGRLERSAYFLTQPSSTSPEKRRITIGIEWHLMQDLNSFDMAHLTSNLCRGWWRLQLTLTSVDALIRRRRVGS